MEAKLQFGKLESGRTKGVKKKYRGNYSSLWHYVFAKWKESKQGIHRKVSEKRRKSGETYIEKPARDYDMLPVKEKKKYAGGLWRYLFEKWKASQWRAKVRAEETPKEISAKTLMSRAQKW